MIDLPCPTPHALTAGSVLQALGVDREGLTPAETEARLRLYGANALPKGRRPSLVRIFLRQFLSPLIYVLLLAGIISLIRGAFGDAVFIGVVTLINAIIGTTQEWSAQRAAAALKYRVPSRARVQRVGEIYEIDAEELVLGDIVVLAVGDKVPADLRLLCAQELELDESVLTGESSPVVKRPEAVLSPKTPISDRINMCFSGTLVTRGRGLGVTVATGPATELKGIAATSLADKSTKPPLFVRMEQFTWRLASVTGIALLVLAVIALNRGMPVLEFLLFAVALGVAAIPEGLPVAITVALAISSRRMARRNVIVRQLAAVEALGSCTFIATDKTGTLTLNELSACCLVFPGEAPWEIVRERKAPEGAILLPAGIDNAQKLIDRLCQAAVLANEGVLERRDGRWIHHGDAVDRALLAMAHKAGIDRSQLLTRFPEIAVLPYEPERGFAASLNRCDGALQVFIKGSPERLLTLCSTMASRRGDQPLDSSLIKAQTQRLASHGYRALAFASGRCPSGVDKTFSGADLLKSLTLLGLVGLTDPLRTEAKAAIERCRQARIEVAMVTGDHPATALAIARELGLAEDPDQVVTGDQLRQAKGADRAILLKGQNRVFARIEPGQKLDIVRALTDQGHFVAVTGDGANDAPALKAAHVGVAMGQRGTEVARESAELIITDDNLASIVAGVEEGRAAYANVRKVIFLSISTGIAAIILFLFALLAGIPLPLLPVQLLWLNLITNGIQGVALAFEPAVGDELKRPPRPPNKPLFDYSMIARVGISALVMGLVAFWIFQDRMADGYTLEAARNSTLLLMVLFENLQVFNSRSEWRSVFLHNPLRNPVLLLGILVTLALHIGAMYTPPLQEILQLQPLPLTEWLRLSGYALAILATMEIYKALGWWTQSYRRSISINKPPIPHSPAAPTMRARPDRQADARRRWR